MDPVAGSGWLAKFCGTHPFPLNWKALCHETAFTQLC
jgi:hypothetical protein